MFVASWVNFSCLNQIFLIISCKITFEEKLIFKSTWNMNYSQVCIRSTNTYNKIILVVKNIVAFLWSLVIHYGSQPIGWTRTNSTHSGEKHVLPLCSSIHCSSNHSSVRDYLKNLVASNNPHFISSHSFGCQECWQGWAGGLTEVTDGFQLVDGLGREPETFLRGLESW